MIDLTLKYLLTLLIYGATVGYHYSGHDEREEEGYAEYSADCLPAQIGRWVQVGQASGS